MMSKFLVKLILIYQRSFSMLMGSRCRFYPSCSHYTREAIELYGSSRGVFLGVSRILKCHPWHEGGFDPVPGTEIRYLDHHNNHHHNDSSCDHNSQFSNSNHQDSSARVKAAEY